MAVTKQYKELMSDFENHFETIQKFYFKNVVILKENGIDLQKILLNHQKELKTQLPIELLNDTKRQYEGILAVYMNSVIHTENSLSVYSLKTTQTILQSITIINDVVTQLTDKSIKIQDKESKKDLFLANKQFKIKYSERNLYEIIKEEIKEICRVNGIVLQK